MKGAFDALRGSARTLAVEAAAEIRRRQDAVAVSAARHGDDGVQEAAIRFLVEIWRERLGFYTWRVFASKSPEPPRRTGRTTQALLLAMAEAVSREMPLSITCGSSDSAGERYCVRMARDLAGALDLQHNGTGLVIEPERLAKISGRPRVMYVDHFDDRFPSE